jgi:phage host-nuclease inhibitor protein Gam
MAKKVKIENKRILNYDDANDLLNEIGNLTAKIDGIVAEADEKINAIREKMNAAIKPIAEMKELLEKKLNKFTDHKVADFKVKRTRKVTSGVFGFKSVAAKVECIAGVTPEQSVEIIQRSRKWKDELLNTTTKLDKAAIKKAVTAKKLTNADLEKFKLEIIKGESFVCNPKLTTETKK